MTAEIVSPRKNAGAKGRALSPEQAAAVAMVAEARQRGLELPSPNGADAENLIRAAHAA